MWMDLVNKVSKPLESHGNASRFGFDSTGTLAVSGDFRGVVRVGPVTGEAPHLLFGHEGMVRDVSVSPDGLWIASCGDDGTMRLYPMPKGTPFHTLPYEELLVRLRTLTNLRAVEDEGSSTGYRLEVGPFPGWEKVPEW
jgi:WD40 repeat protein